MIFLFQIGFLEITWTDILDILLVTILLFQIYKLMQGSIAIKVFLGFLFLYLTYLIVQSLDMELLTSLLGQFMGVGVLAVFILFQQEIRKFLIVIGRTTTFEDGNIIQRLRSLLMDATKDEKIIIIPVLEALKEMSNEKIGGLFVFSKGVELKFYAETGDRIDAQISKRLLLSIFNKHSPLHDGAIIIHNNRIVAARCVLPVTEKDLPAQYGLRHRAGFGMSELTDALIVVVSEETGEITVMQNAEMHHPNSQGEIRKLILGYLMDKPLFETTN